jgi:hypothetical protein
MAAVDGFMRGLTALLGLLNARGRRWQGRVAKWTSASVEAVYAIASGVEAAREADRHRRDVPVRVVHWAVTTYLIVTAVLAVGDYFGVNAILRAANLPPRASFTLPLVISLTVLIGGKVVCALDLGSVSANLTRPAVGQAGPTSADSRLHVVGPPDGQPADGERSADYREHERRLDELSGPVKARKRAVLRWVFVLMGLGIIGLVGGLGALGSQLGGGVGLDDGEHDMLLLACIFGLTSGIVLLNIGASFALAYGMYLPGAGEYRAAVRNSLVKWTYVRLLAWTARAERGSRRLVAMLRASGQRTKVRTALGHQQGMAAALATDPDASSPQAAVLIDRLDDRLVQGDAAGLHESFSDALDELGRHLRADDSTSPASEEDADGDGSVAEGAS